MRSSGVSIDFAAHTFTAIMGPSGSGKSTLLQIAAGLETAVVRAPSSWPGATSPGWTRPR